MVGQGVRASVQARNMRAVNSGAGARARHQKHVCSTDEHALRAAVSYINTQVNVLEVSSQGWDQTMTVCAIQGFNANMKAQHELDNQA